MHPTARISLDYPIYSLTRLTPTTFAIGGGGGLMRSGIPNKLQILTLTPTHNITLTCSVDLSDALVALAAHENALHLLISTGMKSFLYSPPKTLTPASSFTHDLLISSSIDQSAIALSKSHLAIASDEGDLTVLKLPHFQLLHSSKPHSQGVTDLTLHPCLPIIASTARDRTALLTNLETGHPLQSLSPTQPAALRTHIRAIRFTKDPGLLFTAESNPRKGGWLAAWRSQSPAMGQFEPVATIHVSVDALTAFALNASITLCAVSSSEGHVIMVRWDGTSFSKVWTTEPGKTLFRPPPPPHVLPVTAMCFSGTDDCLLTASADYTVAVWPTRAPTDWRKVRRALIWLVSVVVAVFAVMMAEDEALGDGMRRGRDVVGPFLEPGLSKARGAIRPVVKKGVEGVRPYWVEVWGVASPQLDEVQGEMSAVPGLGIRQVREGEIGMKENVEGESANERGEDAGNDESGGELGGVDDSRVDMGVLDNLSSSGGDKQGPARDLDVGSGEVCIASSGADFVRYEVNFVADSKYGGEIVLEAGTEVDGDTDVTKGDKSEGEDEIDDVVADEIAEVEISEIIAGSSSEDDNHGVESQDSMAAVTFEEVEVCEIEKDSAALADLSIDSCDGNAERSTGDGNRGVEDGMSVATFEEVESSETEWKSDALDDENIVVSDINAVNSSRDGSHGAESKDGMSEVTLEEDEAREKEGNSDAVADENTEVIIYEESSLGDDKHGDGSEDGMFAISLEEVEVGETEGNSDALADESIEVGDIAAESSLVDNRSEVEFEDETGAVCTEEVDADKAGGNLEGRSSESEGVDAGRMTENGLNSIGGVAVGTGKGTESADVEETAQDVSDEENIARRINVQGEDKEADIMCEGLRDSEVAVTKDINLASQDNVVEVFEAHDEKKVMEDSSLNWIEEDSGGDERRKKNSGVHGKDMNGDEEGKVEEVGKLVGVEEMEEKSSEVTVNSAGGGEDIARGRTGKKETESTQWSQQGNDVGRFEGTTSTGFTK